MKSLLLILISLNLLAQSSYSIRVAYGNVTPSDLGEVLIGNIKTHKYNLKVLAFDSSYILKRNLYNLPIDISSNIGIAYFDEANQQNNIYETTIYIKAHYKFKNLASRFGFGEGVSYTDDILTTEYLDAIQRSDHYSRFLNYLDISFDVDMGKLLDSKILASTYIGILVKHRSGIFGLIHNVSHGGSNYNTFYLAKDF